jgi:membrane fusion protein (multidrug efflux system)
MVTPPSDCATRVATLPFIRQPESGGQPGESTAAVAAAVASLPKKHWKRRIVLCLVVIATLALLTTGFSWCSYRLDHTVISNARVKGRVYKIGARLDGQVKTVEVEPGQRVLKDQVLIRLEDGHVLAAAREAQAEVQSALKRLEVEKLSIEQARRQLALDIERSDSACRAAAGDLEAALSGRDRWEHEYDRIASLIQSKIGSGSELDNTTAQRDQARALLKAAEARQAGSDANCRLARVQLEGLLVREAGLEVLEADVELARQRLAKCEADVAATVMRAPASGFVIDRIVEPAGSAKVGEPMMSLWLGTPWIEAWTDEKNLASVKIGSPVDITLTAFPDRRLRGTVEAIGVLADKELQPEPVPTTLHSLFVVNAMIPIRIAVPHDQLRLQPGLSALVGIQHETPEFVKKLTRGFNGLVAPIAALFSPSRPATAAEPSLNLHLSTAENGRRKD